MMYTKFVEIKKLLKRLQTLEQSIYLTEFREVYESSGIILFRCSCDLIMFWYTPRELQEENDKVICQECGQPCDRLLITGEWQTQSERDRGNMAAYEAVSG